MQLQITQWRADLVQHPSQSITSIDLVQTIGDVSKPYKMNLVPLSRNTLLRADNLVNIPGSIPAYFPDEKPSWGPSETSIWSATFTEDAFTSRSSLCLADTTPFADLRMGVVLGSGSFAKVFYGTYSGQQVAVKVRLFLFSSSKIWNSMDSNRFQFFCSSFSFFCSSSSCQALQMQASAFILCAHWSGAGVRQLCQGTSEHLPAGRSQRNFSFFFFFSCQNLRSKSKPRS